MSVPAVTGLLLEGVTGSGKTRTLQALQAHPAFQALMRRGRVFVEEETFGEFMDEVRQPEPQPGHRYRRLGQVLHTVEQAAGADGAPYAYVLERFHPSYYALEPEWGRYDAIDQRLRALNCKAVLLSFPTG